MAKRDKRFYMIETLKYLKNKIRNVLLFAVKLILLKITYTQVYIAVKPRV